MTKRKDHTQLKEWLGSAHTRMDWLEINNVGVDGSDGVIGEICYIIDDIVEINKKYKLV